MAQYPGATASDANLYVAVNNKRTQLNGAINNSVTTILVDSTTGFPTAGLISIESEVIAYTGTTATEFTGCTRGFDGTTAASHVDDSFVSLRVVAAHHNASKDEIIAVEADLRAAFGSITPAGPNATDTSLENRIKSILQQLKILGGVTNWYDTPPAVTGAFTNQCINGGFEFWQRNTSFSSPANGTYTADRWVVLRDSAPTFTVSRESGAANVDIYSGSNNHGLYSCKVDITNASAATELRMRTRLENNSYFGARPISVSCRVKTTIAGKIDLNVNGPAQSVSSTTHTGSGNFETLTATLNAVNSGGFVNIQIGFNNFAPVTGTFYIDSVMMVFAAQPVQFYSTEYQTELAQCQRFFEKGYAVDTPIGTSVGSAIFLAASQTAATRSETGMHTYKVEKRVTPTLTVYQLTGGTTNVDWKSTAGVTTARAIDVNVSNTKGFGLRQTSSATDLFVDFSYAADAEI